MRLELEPQDLENLGKLNFGRWVRLDETIYYTRTWDGEHVTVALENGARLSQKGRPIVDDAGDFRVVADSQLEFINFSDKVEYSSGLEKARAETNAIARKRFGIEAIFDPSGA
jgi:hypothetical protein